MNTLGSTGGWLQKRGKLGFWSPKFCKLVGSQLVISKSEKVNNVEFLIEITPDTKIDIVKDPKKHRFSIQDANGEVSVFEARNNDEMMSWILLLRSITFSNPDLNMDCFEVLSVIGRGFYGKVLLVKCKRTGELFAIKSIRKSILIEQNKIRIVLSERNIMVKSHHPFIVQLKFAFQTQSKFYLGLEYVPGGELFTHIYRDGFLQPREYQLVIAQVALALQYLHSIGIIYRDMKPENILIDADGYVKLTDFGLSRDITIDESASTFCGTPEYIAPEVIKRLPYDTAIDWWGLGILTYELIYHNPPFRSTNNQQLFQKILKDEVPFPDNANPIEVNFIKGLLRKDPKKRFCFEEIASNEFFSGFNFDDVLNKRITPPYIPTLEDKANVKYFDNEYTSEQKMDSFVPPVMGDEADVPGFSFYGADTDIANPDNSILAD
ncbi:AGC family protein kinase [Trichomonas vaginalis G3]|uniref:AGC family protein kinase n=1 Tax=Trichomonas vaginalis (strain ATCC PRA-98 / G3) TaxID=412133 RepID=A2DNC5_TRIV3|nr:protein serine/threonine kinase protein [Trichomonas vaginalis G3]EAY18113.1 AGC family protein kinase [Trichomonas vaginalis G3]KAI5492390.1 protein serine/threonine kinase protein [Trichomonas vaginalis G3]|eukprot:XP_001579099.1 AGC family protein kinase [Trichomonas vaginalis G3]